MRDCGSAVGDWNIRLGKQRIYKMVQRTASGGGTDQHPTKGHHRGGVWNVSTASHSVVRGQRDVVGHHVVKSTCLRTRVSQVESVRRHVIASSLGSRGTIPHRVRRFEEGRTVQRCCGRLHVVIVSRFGAHGQRRGTASKKLGAGVRV